MPRRSKHSFSMLLLIIVFMFGVIVGYIAAQEIIPEKKVEQTGIIQLPSNSIVFLPDNEYLGKLLHVLDNANKSVYVVMYVVKYDPREVDDPVNTILEKLVELRGKGLDIKIVVDDETYESYQDTIEYLKYNNVPVKLDESGSRTTHAKIVIIDGEVVLIGSHNWTESALSNNHETTLMVYSKDLAKQVVDYFYRIWSNGRTIP
ncbi:MAG: phospholipase D-like domain-containing protein [Desulfurococcaceae archaeon]